MRILFSHYAVRDKQGFGRSFMLARELASFGHKVTFLTSLPTSEFGFPFKKEFRDEVKLIAFPDIVPTWMRRNGFGIFSGFLKTIYILFHKFDVYHSDNGHRPSGGIPILFKLIFTKLNYFTEWWDNFGKEGQFIIRSPINRFFIGNYDLLFEKVEKKKAAGVIALSEVTRKRALKCGIESDRVVIVHGGADVKKIAYHKTCSFRSKYKIPTHKLCLGFVGMTKGEVDDLIPLFEALRYISDEEICLITTGSLMDEKTVSDYNLRNKLIEFGWLNYNEFSEVISCCDMFILLQRENLQNQCRWPNKLGDYIAAGRPIIANIWGEIKDYELKSPFLFESVNWEFGSIKNCLQNKILNYSIDYKRNSLIRRYAERELSWTRQAKILENFYNRIINMRGNIK